MSETKKPQTSFGFEAETLGLNVFNNCFKIFVRLMLFENKNRNI